METGDEIFHLSDLTFTPWKRSGAGSDGVRKVETGASARSGRSTGTWQSRESYVMG